MEKKKNILARAYLVYVLMCVFALAILYRICVIQFVEGDAWLRKAKIFTTKVEDMEAVRGNIFDANGALLATSLPYYEVAVDINAPSITDKLYRGSRDSLAQCLSRLFADKSPAEYRRILDKARNSNDRYVLLKRNVSHKDLQTIKTFPVLRKGRLGGLVTLQTNKRERPFQMLAGRTIGMSRKGIKPVGLEGAFDSVLMGVSGKRLMQKIAGGVWRPINDENEVEPKDGSDLYTTIDINLQDVASHALLKTLLKNDASHGCAVLMEVKTGEIKAIANLTRSGKDSSVYSESFNYAIGYPTEPGSTFKLASMLALIDDYNVSLDEEVEVGNGECVYYNKTVKDAHEPEAPVLTMKRVFETSSNVGITKLITKYYSKDPQKFADKLVSFHLNKKLGIDIPGEGIPRIPQPRSKYWSGITLPQLSYGYESLITPLQTLALYNAVANDGKMVKPRFVREIRRNGVTVKKFETEVLIPQIVKMETIAKVRKMLEGVVESGSAKSLNITAFKVGGKTGTAQIARKGQYKGRSAYGAVGERTYQASFVGYFPAEKPLYTCIVVINAPGNGVYYGSAVAGPVFKEIAEKVYSSSLNCIEPLNSRKEFLSAVPSIIPARSEDIKKVAAALSLPVAAPKGHGYYACEGTDSLNWKLNPVAFENSLRKGIMPDLSGLSAKDALFLLENNGLSVQVRGFGSVRKQSIQAGKKISKGNTVTLYLG